MADESAFEAAAMGFVLGLFVFAASFLRVRYWSSRRRQTSLSSDAGPDDRRYSPSQVAPSLGGGFREVLEQLLAFEHVMDLLGVLFFAGVLLYGAWVAPRLRLILAVGVATVVGCTFVCFKIARWVGLR